MKLSERIERDQKRDQKRIEKCKKRPLSLFERIHWRRFIRRKIRRYGRVEIEILELKNPFSHDGKFIASNRLKSFVRWLEMNGLYYTYTLLSSQIFVYTKQSVEDLKIDYNVWQKDFTNELSTGDFSDVKGWTMISERKEN